MVLYTDVLTNQTEIWFFSDKCSLYVELFVMSQPMLLSNKIMLPYLTF